MLLGVLFLNIIYQEKSRDVEENCYNFEDFERKVWLVNIGSADCQVAEKGGGAGWDS